MPGAASPKKPLALTLGCPAAIGAEVAIKALAALRQSDAAAPIVLVGDRAAFDARWILAAAAQPAGGFPVPGDLPLAPWPTGRGASVPDIGSAAWFLDVGGAGPVAPGQPTRAGALASVAFVERAVRGVKSGEFAAIVTAPLNKKSLQEAGFPYPGHTEYLGHLADVSNPVMLFAGGPLKVALATIHVPLTQVAPLVTAERLRGLLRTVNCGLRVDFAIPRPRIAVCGLNPHAGESGMLGREDEAHIRPAVAGAREEGIDAHGPLPADTLFARAAAGEFDGVLAMYHDQGLIPVKLAAPGISVNVTLGLPFVRTSVDHGTAYDIAGTGIARESSVLAAIDLAIRILENRGKEKGKNTRY
ncbi:MAG: 4-hydroxythreonine-4-phosphate dehydrogenase PdxA [Planctomycetes bacterium]|nr:4-hydroxythreonine-4-phosphate dehydrogenase PdxA [Planctomycetota bacterium]